MNIADLFDAMRASENDPRPIMLEVRTKSGLFKKVLDGVAFDSDGIYLCGGDADDLPAGSGYRVRVTPLPASRHVEPNGQFYPVGNAQLTKSAEGGNNPERGQDSSASSPKDFESQIARARQEGIKDAIEVVKTRFSRQIRQVDLIAALEAVQPKEPKS